MFKLYIILTIALTSCYPKASNEMEELSRDVLKSKQGIDIEVKPIPKDPSK